LVLSKDASLKVIQGFIKKKSPQTIVRGDIFIEDEIQKKYVSDLSALTL
jgi:hypothetical protein